jgi:hypothetical protein
MKPLNAVAAKYIYLVLGGWLIHLLHLCRFWIAGWNEISALPNFQIDLWKSFWLGMLLVPLLTSISYLLERHRHWAFAIFLFVVFETSSQLVGRSLIKCVCDLAIWGTVLGNDMLYKYYGRNVVEEANVEKLSVLHSELLGVFRTVIQTCMVVVGTIGVSAAGGIFKEYFTEKQLGQSTIWCYIAGILYIALGMVVLLVLPLFRSLVFTRNRILQGK